MFHPLNFAYFVVKNLSICVFLFPLIHMFIWLEFNFPQFVKYFYTYSFNCSSLFGGSKRTGTRRMKAFGNHLKMIQYPSHLPSHATQQKAWRRDHRMKKAKMEKARLKFRCCRDHCAHCSNYSGCWSHCSEGLEQLKAVLMQYHKTLVDDVANTVATILLEKGPHETNLDNYYHKGAMKDFKMRILVLMVMAMKRRCQLPRKP